MTVRIRPIMYGHGDQRRQAGRVEHNRSKQTTSLYEISDPPEQEELDNAFGYAGDMDGFVGMIDDGGASLKCWICAAVNGQWWYKEMVKAA